jgi:hypothetical protein
VLASPSKRDALSLARSRVGKLASERPQISYSFDSEVDSITNGDHAGFRALVRALAVDYANQVAFDYASFCANF